MRRVIGAWVLFVALALPNAGELSFSSGSPALEAARPARSPVRSSAQTLPSDFLSDPLQFLSRSPADSLTLLPGIGPVIAARIVEARGGKVLFKQWDDLLAVRGIGPKKLARLQQLAANGR